LNLLSVENLKVYFKIRRLSAGDGSKKYMKAVDDVSFSLARGKSLGIVGESGCGKTTIARSIMGLQRVTSGRIVFKDNDLLQLKGKNKKALLREIRLIFQNPGASLNPHMRVSAILEEACRVRTGLRDRDEIRQQVQSVLDDVKLVGYKMDNYPFQLSGGEKRRVMIARALFGEPSMIIGDEPLSSLDAIIQDQIIGLLKKLQKRYQFSLIMISHDLDIIKEICEDILVIYQGRIIEKGPENVIFSDDHPHHPYTVMLNQASKLENLDEWSAVLSDQDTEKGCIFSGECRGIGTHPVIESCLSGHPEFHNLNNGHQIACHCIEGIKNGI